MKTSTVCGFFNNLKVYRTLKVLAFNIDRDWLFDRMSLLIVIINQHIVMFHFKIGCRVGLFHGALKLRIVSTTGFKLEYKKKHYCLLYDSQPAIVFILK